VSIEINKIYVWRSAGFPRLGNLRPSQHRQLGLWQLRAKGTKSTESHIIKAAENHYFSAAITTDFAQNSLAFKPPFIVYARRFQSR